MIVDISKMQYPMIALGKVHIGRREYPAGATFDAEKIGIVNYLKKTGTAQMLVKPAATRKVAAPVADVVKTDATPALQVDSHQPMDAPADCAGAEGTHNDSSEEDDTESGDPANRGTGSGRRSRRARSK